MKWLFGSLAIFAIWLLVACSVEQPSPELVPVVETVDSVEGGVPTFATPVRTPTQFIAPSYTPSPAISNEEQSIIHLQLQDETGTYCEEVKIYLDQLARYYSCQDSSDTLYQLTETEVEQLQTWADLFISFDGDTTQKIAGEVFNLHISFMGDGRLPVSDQAREEIALFALALIPAGKTALNNALLPKTPVPTPMIGYIQQCVEVQDTLTPGLLGSGMLLMRGDFGREWVDTYVLTSEEDYPHLFSPYEQVFGQAVSPDRTHIAVYGVYRYVDGSKTDLGLHIVSAEGTLVASMRWQDKWLSLNGWLNPTQLIISSTEALISSENATIYLVNPFTFEVLSVPAKNYNAQLTRYVEVRESSEEKSIAIIENASQEQIFEFGGFKDIYEIRWSPSGNYVSFVGLRVTSSKYEVFVIDKDGTLTNLSGVYNFDPNKIVGTYGPFAWSPNDRYLAYRDYGSSPLGGFNGPIHTLIYDTTLQQITDYCNLALPPASEDWISLIQASVSKGEIVWSPDSTQLIMRGELNDSKDRIILLDRVNNFAVRIYDGVAFLYGWLTTPK